MSQPTDVPERVSGPTCFWLLIALACGATTQPSIGSSRRPSLPCGPLDPARCMPLLCLFDAIYDIFIMLYYLTARLARLLRQDRRETPAEHQSPPTRSMSAFYLFKSALFIMGTLYASVYIFSLRGIPRTQFCAICYFLATSTGFVADVFSPELDGYYPLLLWPAFFHYVFLDHKLEYDDSVVERQGEQNFIMIFMCIPLWGHVAFLAAVCLAPDYPLAIPNSFNLTLLLEFGLLKSFRDMERSSLSPGGQFFDACFWISIISVFYLIYFHNIVGLRWISHVTLTSLIVLFVDFAISSFSEVPWEGIKSGLKRQWVLAACLLTLTTAIDYYFFQFNGDGTVKPAWTEVFGKH